MARTVKLSEAAVEYRQSLVAMGLARNTVDNRTQVIRRAISVWGDILVASIRPVHVDRLFTDGDWSESTRNLYLGNVRQFFQWCRHHGYMQKDFDPAFGWRNTRVPEREKMRLPVEQFYPLMDACQHPRDRAMCAVGLFVFPRGGEILTMRIADLDLAAGTLEVYRHKTKQSDVMPVCEELRVELVSWLNWYRADQGGLDPGWFLFPRKASPVWVYRDGHPVATEPKVALIPSKPMGKPYVAVQKALAALGYETHGEGEHTLRRSGARAYFDVLREQGVDGALLRVASMLGHKDLKVTQEYIGLRTEREQRNASLKGKPMFPNLERGAEAGKLRVIQGGA